MRRVVEALGALLILGGCAASGPPSAERAEEIEVRPMLISGMGIMRVPALEAHIRDIETQLLAQIPDRPRPPRVFLVPTTDFIAESGPTGGIFISLGTLRGLHSEDAMAFVVAHELGHIQLGHTATRGGAEDWSHTLHILAVGSLRMASHSTLQASSLGDLSQAPMRAVLFANGAGAVADNALFPGWNRTQEREADQYALALMVKAGYSPAGADEVFDRLEAIDKAEDEQLARIQAAAARAQQQRPRAENLQDALSAAVTGMVTDVAHALTDWATQRSASHDAARERHARVATEIDQHHADADMVVHTASWSSAMAQPDTASRLAAYAVMDQADDAYYSGRAGQAARLMSLIDASPIASEPRPVDLRAHLLAGAGRKDDARLMLINLVRQPDVIMDAYVQLIDLNLQQGHIPQAVAAMRIARGVLQDPQELFPTDLLVLRLANMQLEKSFVLSRCYLVGDDVLSQQCKVAAGA